MKNIIEICKDFGIEIPAEKHADFLKAVNGEYKTVSDYNKQVEKTNAATQRAGTAEEALKGFEGLGNAADVKKQLEDANQKIKEAQEAARKQLDERDFNDALKAELDGITFSSAAAKKAVEAEIRAAGLKLKDGKILGLSDLIGQLKKDDASAFVDDKNHPPRFTQPAGNGGVPTPAGITKEAFSKMSYKDRLKIFNDNPALYKELTK